MAPILSVKINASISLNTIAKQDVPGAKLLCKKTNILKEEKNEIKNRLENFKRHVTDLLIRNWQWGNKSV